MRERVLPFQRSRLVFFSVVMLCSFAVLMYRLYEFQFIRGEFFEAAARENALQSVPLPATRGIIYDRYGMPLALNAPAFNVSVTPAYVPDDEEALLRMLNRLSALIDVPATRAAAEAAGRRFVRSLQEQIAEGQGIAPYRPVVVATDVPQAIAQTILEDLQNLPGVSVEVVSVRQYPSGSLTSQIIGYLGPIGEAEARELREQGYNPAFERVGYAGVEAYFERDLAGQRGLETRIVDVAGLPIQVINRREPVAGKNIRLTIDLALQRVAEQALQDRINLINASKQAQVTISGSVIAMDLRTGEILAMVSLPTYDNTRFARAIDGEYYLRIANEPQTPLVNHAIQSLYPPGSVWKLVTAAGVLEEKVVPWDYKLYDAGELFVDNSFATNDIGQRQRFVCWLPIEVGGHKWVNMVEGIAWSCDVYFYQVGGGNPDPNVSMVLKPGGLGIENLNRYATALNIGVRTGIELPAENGGRMPDRTWKRRNYGESWSTGDTYNAAFGQGYVTVTPLQLLVASAALANGGTLYQPTILHSFLDPEGNVLTPFTPKVARTLLPPEPGQIAVLNMREDMLLQGKNSLACICEPRSPYKDPNNPDFYDPSLPDCTEEFKQNYRRTVTLEGRGQITYTVHIPYGYRFGGVCNPLFINDALYRNYQPPFISAFNLSVIQEGMRQAVINSGGTAKRFDLGYVQTAGKTGTAEYCDDIAAARQLCKPGQWPAHAWFFGYAPYEKPEIGVIAFVYNAGEGSANALPVAKAVVDCYFKLKSQREQGIPNDKVSCTPIQD
ncbi:MAG: hypothetical protein CUN49_04175 [Candidatus Thermofonsia Clade 1 bacterium]|uniref:Penicillin-binding protein 2 n=1 Tax=Candidatus Thermofonsia Clade 1 bacterium TaxID=2364210 RepID=A0A2M8PGK4_9CHLR|nr:MAG: hypothetical protein CUN49_04175 [Candidatus Thermofonsia Clade 1 bacterium]